MSSKFVQDTPLPSADGDRKFYGRDRTGAGRWAVLDRIGVLWTNDRDSVQILLRNGPRDSRRLNDLALLLVEFANVDLAPSAAFDVVVADYGSPVVHTGDLETLA